MRCSVVSFSFFFFFLPFAPLPNSIGQMGGDGFAFAVRVRRQIDRVSGLCQLLQLGEDFFFARNDDVFGLEVVVHIHTQSALGQVFDVAERGLDRVTLAQDISGWFSPSQAIRR